MVCFVNLGVNLGVNLVRIKFCDIAFRPFFGYPRGRVSSSEILMKCSSAECKVEQPISVAAAIQLSILAASLSAASKISTSVSIDLVLYCVHESWRRISQFRNVFLQHVCDPIVFFAISSAGILPSKDPPQKSVYECGHRDHA